MWWVLGGIAAVTLYNLMKNWGWERNYRRTDEDINRLPEAPGVYILHFPGLQAVYIGSTNNLRRRLKEHKRQKPGWSSFDWCQTNTVERARVLEKKLRDEVSVRQ
ncbi:MAG: GIY-YIG nuclease family protein [Candidatus Bipolaricaulia bacterium]